MGHLVHQWYVPTAYGCYLILRSLRRRRLQRQTPHGGILFFLALVQRCELGQAVASWKCLESVPANLLIRTFQVRCREDNPILGEKGRSRSYADRQKMSKSWMRLRSVKRGVHREGTGMSKDHPSRCTKALSSLKSIRCR